MTGPPCRSRLLAPARRRCRRRPMEIYFIDVMGGAATLLVTPEGESVLIDSGWPGADDRDPKRIEAVFETRPSSTTSTT